MGDLGALGKFGPRHWHKPRVAPEFKSRIASSVFELGAKLGRQAQPVSIKGERFLQVVDCESDAINRWFQMLCRM